MRPCCNLYMFTISFSLSLVVLGFNDTSTLVGHVSSPRERENRDRRDSRGNEREGQWRRRKMNESEETEEVKISPLRAPAAMVAALPNYKPISVGRPVTQDTRHLCHTQPPPVFITKTCLYNFDPLKPHFYIVKLGFTGVYIIFLSFAFYLKIFLFFWL